MNFQEVMLDISNSNIYIEGKTTLTDLRKRCFLSNDALAFLFDEIHYEMGGVKVAMVRKPGITLTIRNMLFHTNYIPFIRKLIYR